jgi:hypothetical protein
MVMKANKVLKRLAKIEALVSDVTARFSAGAPHVSGVLKDLKAAVARVKEAVSAHVALRTTKKKTTPARKKAAARKKAVKAPKAKTAKRAVRTKRAVKKRAAEQTAPAPAQLAEAAAQESTSSN